MKIAVTAEDDNGLDSVIAQHFGHAPYFVFVDVNDGEVIGTQGTQNPFGGGHAPGQVPSFIKEQGAEVILSGGMGGRAVEFFENIGIQAATGASGTVREGVKMYLDGLLTGAAPCTDSIEHGAEG